MKYERLTQEACERFPEVRKEYDVQIENGEINKDLGQHIFFCF